MIYFFPKEEWKMALKMFIVVTRSAGDELLILWDYLHLATNYINIYKVNCLKSMKAEKY